MSVLADQSDETCGNRGDEDEPGDPAIGRVDPPLADRPEPGADEGHDVRPEVHRDRDERSQVERNVVGLVEAVVLLEEGPLGGPRHEDQVGGRRDRQQLREALDEAEHERLPVRQGVGVVAHAEQREDEGETDRRPREAEHEGATHGEILRLGALSEAEKKSDANCGNPVNALLDRSGRVP